MTEANLYDIAIIGMAGRFPGAQTPSEFWRRVRDGENCISFLSEEQLRAAGVEESVFSDSTYVRAAPVLSGVEWFDEHFFGITPREAELMDPQQRLFLECCWEALEQAGYDATRYPEPVGVFAGARTDTYLASLLTHPEMLASIGMFHLGLGNDLAFLTTRVSHLLNLRGPSCSLHTACSTSLVAVHLACQSLLIDECRMALAGGVAVNVPHEVGYKYEEGSVQSPDGFCRAFDARARGTVFGSGAGVVVLKRLEDALAEGDTIHAVIRGSSVNNDGAAKASFTAPSVQGQVRVLEDALLSSHVPSDSISYVECHGTGTLLGDAIEVRALKRVFGPGEPGRCALGSVKTNVGHLDAAAGITSLIKVILSLKHRMLPPSLHFREPNPQIDFAGSPFYVNAELRRWESRGGPLRAGVSAFGVGGTNAHVIVEEAPKVESEHPARPWQLLVVSARSETALQRLEGSLAAHLQGHPEQELADVAYTLQVGRQRFGRRRSIVCGSREEAIRRLQEPQEPGETHDGGEEEDLPGVAFLFPGQGAEYAGLGRELYEQEEVFSQHLNRCWEILQPGLDPREIWSLNATKSEDSRMDRGWLAQPALMAIEYALAQLWMSWGVRPEALVGHGVGEYTAACIGGVMTLEEGLRIVAERGRLMQQGRTGGMLTVSLAVDVLERLLEGEMMVAAINAPDSCVVSGPWEAILQLEKRLQIEGAVYQRRSIPHTYHFGVVEPAMKPLMEELRVARLQPPRIPIVSGVTGQWMTTDQAQDPGYWAGQMSKTVQFDAALQNLLREPGRVLLEVGPGQSLRRLVLRQPTAPHERLLLSSLPDSGEGSECRSVMGAMGRLWEAGIAVVDWKAFHHRSKRMRVPLPTYPFERKRHWIDPAPLQVKDKDLKENLSGKILKDSDISQWFWVPSWKRTVLAQEGKNPLHEKASWTVFVDKKGIGAQLTSRLRDAGQEVVEVRRGTGFRRDSQQMWTIDAENVAHYAQLLASIAEGDKRDFRIAFLWSVDDIPSRGSHSADFERQTDSLCSLLYLLQAASADQVGKVQLWMIDHGLLCVESSDEILPQKAGLLTLCRVASQEKPELVCSVIDISAQSTLETTVTRILNEFKSGRMNSTIAYRGHYRWLQHFETSPIVPAAVPSRTLAVGGTYLITGGLGAVGLLIAQHFAGSLQANLVLVNRSSVPPRDQWPGILQRQDDDLLVRRISTLSAMELNGTQIEFEEADVCDQAAMQSVVDRCYHRFGRLDGVIHGAGITNGPTVFCPLRDLNREAMAVQGRPKAQGLSVLREVLKDRDVPFVLALSSNAAVLGGLGFGAYAAANAYMDAFSIAASRNGTTAWLSANWDHWPEETKQLAQYRTSLDQYAMTRGEALDALDRILHNFDSGQIIVATGNLQQRLAIWLAQSPTRANSNGTAQSSVARNPRPRLKTLYVAPRNDVERKIARIWEDFLGLQSIGVHDDFFELGGHSLLAARLIAEIGSSLNIDIPLTKLFEGPTVAKMSEAVAQPDEGEAASNSSAYASQ